MSILARAKSKAPDAGYAKDFVDAVIAPFARDIAETGTKLIANAGGVNPESCGRAVRAILAKAGLDLKVAVITDDDRMEDIPSACATGKRLPHRDSNFDENIPKLTIATPANVTGRVDVKVEDLAWARSGDKGDKANIGVIARKATYVAALWSALTPEYVGQVFAQYMEDVTEVERFYLPGSNAINFLMDRSLGGGGAASLRNDAQAKGFGQILLAQRISVPANIAKDVNT